MQTSSPQSKSYSTEAKPNQIKHA
uniref:Uncharacterized protein n=1 Tax=Arundo donax TaxID=35708 RepID=A0A0A9C2M3_ARUDO